MDIGLETLLETRLHLWSLEFLHLQTHIPLLYQQLVNKSSEKLLYCPPRTDDLYIYTVAVLTMRTCISSTLLTSDEVRTGFQQPGPLKNVLTCVLLKIAEETIHPRVIVQSCISDTGYFCHNVVRDTEPEQHTPTALGAISLSSVSGIFPDWFHCFGTLPSLVQLYSNIIFHFHLVTSVSLMTSLSFKFPYNKQSSV